MAKTQPKISNQKPLKSSNISFYRKQRKLTIKLITEEDIKQLLALIENLRNGFKCAEVGCFIGSTSVEIAKIAQKKKGHLFCIDIFDDYPWCKDFLLNHRWYAEKTIEEQYQYNIETNQVTDVIKTIKDLSINAANEMTNESLDLVFLDASHDFQNVLLDLEVWFPTLTNNGSLVCHDYHSCSSVKMAVQFFSKQNNIKVKEIGNDLVILTKKRNSSF